jgi:hypothetical protein
VSKREGVSMQASGFSVGSLNPLYGIEEVLKPLAMKAFGLHQEL